MWQCTQGEQNTIPAQAQFTEWVHLLGILMLMQLDVAWTAYLTGGNLDTTEPYA